MINDKQNTELNKNQNYTHRRNVNRIMDKPNPMLRDKPNLKLAEEIPPEEISRRKREKLKSRVSLIFPLLIFLTMVVIGNYILLTYRFHGYARTSSIYIHNLEETGNYEAFDDGIIRYNREGVMFLNQRNREQWIQPAQFNNPVFVSSERAFAIFDQGGNGIQVFNSRGLIGEFETSFPIERLSVSNQGIVSAILRNDYAPLIMTFDAVGNLLVEKQVPLATMGYPTALALSRDGTGMAVGYLSINGGRINSTVVHYNFSNVPFASPDFIVNQEVFEDKVIVDLFFTEDNLSVAITDTSFIIFEDTLSPRIREHVYIDEEIISVFYTNEYIGYVSLNQERVGYELRLYDTYGIKVMSREFTGEYSNIRMIGNDIFMFDGFGICIISRQGVIRFQGNLEVNPLLVMPAFGVNRFYVMSDTDLRIITLVR
jgi:hypothetical protein